jgi:outer membrane PBP1 activator LpoA protein
VPAIIPRSPSVQLLGIITLILTLAGCSTPQHTPAATDTVPTADRPAAETAAATQARELLAAAQREQQAGATARALQLYSRIDPDTLPQAPRGAYLLGHADAALQEGEILLARDLLTTPAATALGKTLAGDRRQRWLRLRGELFGLLGETAESLSAYTALAAELPDPKARADIEQRIWTVLQQTPTSALRKLAAEPADPRLHSWYQLALAGRQPEAPTTPALGAAPRVERARILAPEEVQALNRVALLLPESGAYATAAGILRDGFLAAAFAARTGGVQPPDIRFYDTAADDVLALYQRAVNDGAQLVIGPIEPELLRRIRDHGRLPVPVLALNYLDTDTATGDFGFYQFGLSVADEAKAVAHTAWRDGRRSALALVPDTGWGSRALRTFTDTFRELGGEVKEAVHYDMALKDFTPVLRPLLAPRPAAPAPPGAGGDAEPPRRRGDLDMVFLVAYPTQGRQIQPTLEFLYAGDLPIYATSAIYSGTPDPARDRDLGDIRFNASPWTLTDPGQLSPRPDDRLPQAHRQLFALGVDSYLLHAQLADGMPGLAQPVYGQTGLLMMDGNGRVMRLQPWARFRNGRAAPLSPAEPGT